MNNLCNCGTYKFPHRPGSGQCQNIDADEPYCAECGSTRFQNNGPEPGTGMRNEAQCLYCGAISNIIFPEGWEAE